MSKRVKNTSGTTFFENAWLHSNSTQRCKIENFMAKRSSKNKKKKSHSTIAQEIEAMKLLSQYFNTHDVCELASRGLI